jgi:hypothetical protein
MFNPKGGGMSKILYTVEKRQRFNLKRAIRLRCCKLEAMKLSAAP